MVRILFAALFAAIVFSGWTTPASAIPKSYLTTEGATRMMAAKGIKAQWHTARKICVEDGLAQGTEQFKRCFAEYQLHSLRAIRTRAKGLTDAVAKQHGLCIDRHRFEIARCTPI
ncbi:MAG: hypothetical protein O3C49_05115 [Proteobacteria bacterium]|nr:hypothetical protein [Pseudomonadota bacterium]MDA1325531.1 hypothetical protein [Pseudomonadota bacterium]